MNRAFKLTTPDASTDPTNLTRRGFVVGAALAGSSLLVGCSQADILSFGGDHKIGALRKVRAKFR